MPETIICTNCQSENNPGSRFCLHCGTKLPQPEAVNVQPPEPAPPGPRSKPARSTTYTGRPSSQSYSQDGRSRGGGGGAHRIDRLGTRLDGWADVVLDAGERAEAVMDTFEQMLAAQQMPHIDIYRQQITSGGLMGERRSYELVKHEVGTTLAVYIASFGQNLYMSWDLFVRPVIQWLVLGGILVAAGLFGALITDSLFTWLPATFIFFLFFAFIVGVAGRVLRGSFTAFFMREVDHFVADDLAAMSLSTHKTILAAVDAAGLDVDLLRSKREFRAGQRERVI